jgi:hypothetical protein
MNCIMLPLSPSALELSSELEKRKKRNSSIRNTLLFEKESCFLLQYRGADKSLARPGRKQATATENFDIYTIYNHNWRNISTVCVCMYIIKLASNEIF